MNIQANQVVSRCVLPANPQIILALRDRHPDPSMRGLRRVHTVSGDLDLGFDNELDFCDLGGHSLLLF